MVISYLTAKLLIPPANFVYNVVVKLYSIIDHGLSHCDTAVSIVQCLRLVPKI